jgi:hypothetical protein
VEILRKGKLPEEGVYQGDCAYCECRVQCSLLELTGTSDGRNGTDYYVQCPTPECERRIYCYPVEE